MCYGKFSDFKLFFSCMHFVNNIMQWHQPNHQAKQIQTKYKIRLQEVTYDAKIQTRCFWLLLP